MISITKVYRIESWMRNESGDRRAYKAIKKLWNLPEDVTNITFRQYGGEDHCPLCTSPLTVITYNHNNRFYSIIECPTCEYRKTSSTDLKEFDTTLTPEKINPYLTLLHEICAFRDELLAIKYKKYKTLDPEYYHQCVTKERGPIV